MPRRFFFQLQLCLCSWSNRSSAFVSLLVSDSCSGSWFTSGHEKQTPRFVFFSHTGEWNAEWETVWVTKGSGAEVSRGQDVIPSCCHSFTAASCITYRVTSLSSAAVVSVFNVLYNHVDRECRRSGSTDCGAIICSSFVFIILLFMLSAHYYTKSRTKWRWHSVMTCMQGVHRHWKTM